MVSSIAMVYRLSSNDSCAMLNCNIDNELGDALAHEVTTARLSINSGIEQRQIAGSSLALKIERNGPDLLRLE